VREKLNNLGSFSSLAERYLSAAFFQMPACKIFTALPLWISQGFQLHNHQVNCALGQANLYLTLYLHLQDDFIDEPKKTDPYLQLLGTFFLVQLSKLYNTLFSCNSTIWTTFEDVFTSYACTALEEKKLQFESLDQISDGCDIDVSFMGQKFSPLKLCCHAHALLSRSEEKKHVLFEMIDHYGTALQLHNDLMDWRGDLERGQLSYPTLLLLREYRRCFGKSPTFEGMRVFMANSPVVGNVLKTEITYLEKARTAIEDINLPLLQQHLASLIKTLRSDLSVVERIRSSLFDFLELGNESSHYARE
jgi:hypothetical protein